MEEQNKSLPPLIAQIILTKLGMFCSERLSVDLYYIVEAINLLLPTFDIGLLKKDYNYLHGDGEFDKAIKNLKFINILVTQSKSFYDALSDKSLSKRISTIKSSNKNEEEVNGILKKYWYETSSKLCLLNTSLYNLFVFLIYNSPIKNRTIATEYFKNLEQKDNRKINLDPRRRDGDTN